MQLGLRYDVIERISQITTRILFYSFDVNMLLKMVSFYPIFSGFALTTPKSVKICNESKQKIKHERILMEFPQAQYQ